MGQPRADTHHVKTRAWIVYLAVLGAAATAYVFVHAIRVGPLFNAVGLSAPIAILLGVRLHPPRKPLAWYLVAEGQTLFVGGDVITYNYQRFFGSAVPFPSIGDLLYLSVYPFLVAGILMMIRERSPGRWQEKRALPPGSGHPCRAARRAGRPRSGP